MAYLFNSLSEDQDSSEKQNIFGGQQTSQGTTSGQPQQSDSITMQGGSSNAGSGGRASSRTSGLVGGSSQPKQSSSSPQVASQAFKIQASQQKMPTSAVSRAEGSIQSASQDLQNKANAYGAKAQETAKGFDLSDNVLKGAVTGNEADFKTASERLGKGSPGLFESFEGLEKLPNISGVQDLGNIYRSEAGPSYTAGQGRFDAALLRNNPAFIAKQREIAAADKSLRDKEQGLRESETKAARDLITQGFDKSTADIKGKIKGMSDAALADAKAQEIAEDKRRAGLDAKALSAAELAKLKEQMRKDLNTGDPTSFSSRSAGMLDSENLDLSNFMNIDRDTDWRDFIIQDQADIYNRAQSLLGNEGEILSEKALPTYDYNFDIPGAYEKLRETIQGKRSVKDRESAARIDALRADLDARAKARNQAIAAAMPKDDPVSRMGSIYGMPDIPQVAYTPQELTWQNIMSAQEAEELNALEQDLGVVNPGRYRQGGFVSDRN